MDTKKIYPPRQFPYKGTRAWLAMVVNITLGLLVARDSLAQNNQSKAGVIAVPSLCGSLFSLCCGGDSDACAAHLQYCDEPLTCIDIFYCYLTSDPQECIRQVRESLQRNSH